MEPNNFNTKKLAGVQLAEFAAQSTADKLSVLVELTGDTQIEFSERKSDGDPRKPIALLPFDAEGERRRMDKLQQALAKLVGGKMVRLDAAQAYVVDVTPEQLRAVTLLENVCMVRPNRTHRPPG